MTQTLARLSLNQQTIKQWSLPEAVDGCARAGIPAIGLWREPVAETGLSFAAKLVRDAGLRVSSLCRGGFLTYGDASVRARALEQNKQAIAEAAELGAACLVLVVGGLPEGSRDLPGAREQVYELLAELIGPAESHGVHLALEPLHPMFCADRAVLSTLGQALTMAKRLNSGHVGVVVDAYHVWWDPALPDDIAAAGDRILSFQVCDWTLPLAADTLSSRGMMGDGHIDLRAMRRLVDTAGYSGDIEVEIFNTDLWAADGTEVLKTMVDRYIEHVI